MLLMSCKREVPGTWMTPQRAEYYFNRVEEICNRDNGKLWGRNLSGPLMFVDRKSRKIYANKPDNENLLKSKEKIYTGTFPKEKVINNAAVTYGGVLYGMVPIPDSEDEYRVISRAVRSLFHRFQETIGIPHENFIAANMDDKEARLWIKFEWKALKKAIGSEGEEQLQSLRDALIFRGSNRETYPNYATDENRFETYEGLATFTYIMLATSSREEFRKRLFEYLDRIYSYQSYSRSFGFISGALYATLLYEKGFDLKTIKDDNTDLGKLACDLYKIQLPAVCRDVAGSISMNYNTKEVFREEEKRLSDIKEKIITEASTFTERPVVYLDLESPYFDFEPEDIHSLDTLGTLYLSIRVSDNWGKLNVDKGGCLVSNNFKYLRITAKGLKKDKNHIYGDGWHLILNDNWEMAQVNQNYFVRKMMP